MLERVVDHLAKAIHPTWKYTEVIDMKIVLDQRLIYDSNTEY